MINILLSALVGVLVGKLMDSNMKTYQKQNVTYVVASLFLFLLIALYNAVGNMAHPPKVYEWLENAFGNLEKSILGQSICIVLVVILITRINIKESGMYKFKQYSKKISDFTSKMHAGSTVTLVAGDMDFFGGVEVEDTKITRLMKENDEYRQLHSMRNKINLRILCSNKLVAGSLDSILNNTVSSKSIYNKYRFGGNFTNPAFQYMLRIGKIKSDFSNVEIRFYNSEQDDKLLRARFVDGEGIVYREEGKKRGEPLYSVNYLSKLEFEHYNELFTMKWNSCDLDKCNKFVAFCESLYHYVRDEEVLYKMALVYVDSYEVARKGSARKEFPPFGVLYLAASVDQEKDWKVDVISVNEDTKIDELNWKEYDVIGLSIVSSYSYGVLKKCYNASEKRKDVITLAGGYQAEKFCNDVFIDFNADIIFKGEGEESIREFCHCYKERKFSDIKGIIYKDVNNKTGSTPGRGMVDINKIPEPLREALPTQDIVMTDRLAGTETKMVHIMFSRGCPYHCAYCAANQDGNNCNHRYRDKRMIVKELKNLKATYGIEGFSIIDDCFLTDQEKAIEICKGIADAKLDLVWSLAARADHINDGVLDVLKNAGCIEIKFGIETGSDRLLTEMRKNITVAKAEEAIRKTKSKGIMVKVFIITGLPGETDDTHNETKAFLERMYNEELIDRVSLLRYTPLAGSYIFNNPHKYKINNRALQIKNFDKMRLYRKSYDWWTERGRWEKCNEWYEDMSTFINDKWSEE